MTQLEIRMAYLWGQISYEEFSILMEEFNDAS